MRVLKTLQLEATKQKPWIAASDLAKSEEGDDDILNLFEDDVYE